jgi:uncharacterized membrane protein YdjX (TVP38/TMEM64 family)
MTSASPERLSPARTEDTRGGDLVTRGRARRRTFPWRWILGGLGIAASFVVWWLMPVEQWLEQVQGSMARMGALGGLVFGLLYVVAALLFVPGSVLTLGAGLVFGLGWGTVVASAAATTTAGAAFLITRYLARDRVARLARRHEKFGAIDEAVREKGWKVVALLRLSPLVPFSVSNYLYGLTAIRFWPYLLASWVAMLPGTVLYVYLGAAGRAAVGGARKHSAWEWVLLAAGLVATVAVTVLLTRTARKELERGHAGRKP